jgi:curved DNA-binding protein CbpA
MSDPFTILNLSADSNDETIRRRYLELIRIHSPERDPDKFASVRAAYEKLRDPVARLQYRLFGVGEDDSIEALLLDARAATPMRRATVEELLALGRNQT